MGVDRDAGKKGVRRRRRWTPIRRESERADLRILVRLTRPSSVSICEICGCFPPSESASTGAVCGRPPIVPRPELDQPPGSSGPAPDARPELASFARDSPPRTAPELPERPPRIGFVCARTARIDRPCNRCNFPDPMPRSIGFVRARFRAAIAPYVTQDQGFLGFEAIDRGAGLGSFARASRSARPRPAAPSRRARIGFVRAALRARPVPSARSDPRDGPAE
jgi:hypothetical protein